MRGHVILDAWHRELDWELVTSKITGLMSPLEEFFSLVYLFLAYIWPSFTDIIHTYGCCFSATIDRANFGLGIFVCFLRHILIVEFTIDILNRAIK